MGKKWCDDEIIMAIEMLKSGKTYSEIAVKLNRSVKSVKCRLNKENEYYFKYNEKPPKFCQNCGIEITSKDGKKFCGRSCSTVFNNKKRVHSDETKQKLKEINLGKKASKETIEKISGENNHNWIDGRSLKRVIITQNGKRVCKYCKEFKLLGNKKLTCDECKFKYYRLYRPACEFDFDLNDYPNKFDLDLIREHGWYSPSNKGNNLNGVSRDHLYSVSDGFNNGVDPNILKHPANCGLVLHIENQKKKNNSSITLDELMDRIKNWDIK